MSDQTKMEKASFKIQGSKGKKIRVHFNPESLQYTISNTINKGKGSKTKQYTSKSTGKLTMNLVFDTTHSGEDVRLHTVKVANFMNPKKKNAPPIVIFNWGLYTFNGTVESYKENIDFFSSDGIPLRASVDLTMSSQDDVFEGGSINSNTDAIPAYPFPGKGATGLAAQGGNPAAGRKVAQDNGVENMRFPGQASLEIDGSVSLKPPSAFASGGLGISAGGGIGLGINVGGAGVSAGVSASAGAFAGLRSSPKMSSSAVKLNLDNFIDEEVTTSFGTDDESSFGLGGQAGLQGSASFKADVGKTGKLKGRIEFDGD